LPHQQESLAMAAMKERLKTIFRAKTPATSGAK